VPKTNRPYNLPAIGKKIAYHAHRDGVAERFTDPAVHKSIEVDLALIGCSEAWLRDLDLAIVRAATHHDATTVYLLRRVPGIGKSLSLVWLYESHDIERFPRVQAFASSGRLVKGAKASAGKRSGTSGANIGNAHLTWAFSEAAGLCWRDPPAGQKLLASSEKNIVREKPSRAWRINWRGPSMTG
jgi:transposase